MSLAEFVNWNWCLDCGEDGSESHFLFVINGAIRKDLGMICGVVAENSFLVRVS